MIQPFPSRFLGPLLTRPRGLDSLKGNRVFEGEDLEDEGLAGEDDEDLTGEEDEGALARVLLEDGAALADAGRIGRAIASTGAGSGSTDILIDLVARESAAETISGA